MSNIEFDLDANNVKTTIRANRVVIQNPADGAPSVAFRNEKVVKVDGVTEGTSKLPSTNRDIANVATETITLTDPVTGQPVTVSAAGLASIIEAFYIKWWQEDNPS